MKRFLLKQDGEGSCDAFADECNQPAPGQGEVLVKIEACSLNYRDLLMKAGLSASGGGGDVVPLSDGAGVGDGVEEWQEGDRVALAFFPRLGGWSLWNAVPSGGTRRFLRWGAFRVCVSSSSQSRGCARSTFYSRGLDLTLRCRDSLASLNGAQSSRKKGRHCALSRHRRGFDICAANRESSGSQGNHHQQLRRKVGASEEAWS